MNNATFFSHQLVFICGDCLLSISSSVAGAGKKRNDLFSD